MFKNFLSNNKTQLKCIVLYTLQYDRTLTKNIFENIISYFKSVYKVDFRYAGFYDEKYVDKYGSFDVVFSKVVNSDSKEIVNFTLDVDDLRKKKRSISVEFNLAKPIHITLVVPESFVFNVVDFSHEIYGLFKVQYGLSYYTDEPYWTTAYAIGDAQHSKDIRNVRRISHDAIKHWVTNCQKILDGNIRDIYEENVLTVAHLNRPLNGLTLQEFITKQSIGELCTINNDLFFWRINEKEIKQARDYLDKTDIMI